ncbi:hypothetical protein K492DRAFT_199705 [Lichtheimia hyalospora FSU 10163]|nr:hypothetical protein K492DRAFT_199705 [Lichtheimia hyalospora FSU 10163]
MAATRLISSKKSVHDLMGTYNIGSTKNVQFINVSYNETAAAQGPGHGDRVGSGKERSYVIWQRIWKALAWLYYYWLYVEDVIVSICIA